MSIIAGYKYFFGIHMGIARGPLDELIQIQVGDRNVWTGSVTESGDITITAPEVFGGNDGEGGIEGEAKVMFGEPTQTAPTELVTMLGEALPGFRRMFTFFFDGLVTAMNPYPKPWKFRVRRARMGWDGACWHPELAAISLTRPSTPAEIQEPVVDVVNGFVHFTGGRFVVGGAITVDPVDDSRDDAYIPPGAQLTEIVEIAYITGSGESFDYVTLTVGVDYTWAGFGTNTIVFTPAWEGLGLTVRYRYRAVYTSGSGGVAVNTIQAMNPAHMIYECLTNREWGRGLHRDDLDDGSFLASALTLYGEGFGLCMKWSRVDDIGVFVQNILDHIGAVLYSDRSTALLKLDLIRGGYDPATLPLYDSESGLIECKQAAVPTPRGLINEVQVQYRDPVTDKSAFVKAQNLAMKQAAGGGSNVLKREYSGIPTAALAGRVAQRDLRANGIGLRRFELVFDRRGSGIVPGSVIRIRDLPRKINDVVVRVGRFDEDSRGVKITAVQDAFGFPASTFTGHEPNAWTPPNRRPCIGRLKVFEAPYITLYRRKTPADFATIADTDAYLGTLMETGQALNASYRIAVKDGAVDHLTEDPADAGYYCGYTP